MSKRVGTIRDATLAWEDGYIIIEHDGKALQMTRIAEPLEPVGFVELRRSGYIATLESLNYLTASLTSWLFRLVGVKLPIPQAPRLRTNGRVLWLGENSQRYTTNAYGSDLQKMMFGWQAVRG